MKAVAPNQTSIDAAIESVTKAAIKAFMAGCDCMILGYLDWADCNVGPEEDMYIIKKVIQNFTQAVKNGTIPEKRLNESIQRILKVKKQRLEEHSY